MHLLFSPSESTVPEALEKLLTTFTGEYSQTLNRIFRVLYERICRKRDIATEHPLLASQLDQLTIKMSEEWQKASDLYAKIPKLTNTKVKISALSRMLELETTAWQLANRCKKLIALLKSREHQQALVYYKEKVKQCEALTTATKETFTALFHEVKEKARTLQSEDEMVQNEIALLFDEIFQYIVYTARSFQITCMPGNTLVFMPYERSCTPQAGSTVQLPSEYYFRNGQMAVHMPVVGYSGISSEISNLQECAKSLYQVEVNIQKRRKAICALDLEPHSFLIGQTEDIQTVYAAEEAIQAQKFQLTTKPLSTHNHAGWSYVACLVEQARWLHQELVELSDGQLTTYANVIRILQTEPQLPLIAETLTKLPEASPPLERTFKVLQQTFGQEKTSKAVLTGDEQHFAADIFRRSLHWHSYEDELVSFLTKGFINPSCEFEAVLYRMMHDPLYTADFTRTIENSETLLPLYNSYQQTKNDNRITIIKRITNALIHLYELPCSHPHHQFVRLHKAYRLYRTLQNCQFSDLVTWFKAKLSDITATWNSASAPTDTLLYKWLYISLFGTDAEKKETADLEIAKMLKTEIPTEKGITKVLLYRWVLERHMARNQVNNVVDQLSHLLLDDDNGSEQAILKSLFAGYVAKPAFWREQYDVGYMEIALQKYYTESKEAIRDTSWSLLKQFISLYIKFRNSKATDKDVYKQICALLPTQRSETDVENLQIARALLNEMKEFLHHGRIFYTRSLQ